MNCRLVLTSIEDYLAGLLHEDTEAAIDQHLESCEGCAEAAGRAAEERAGSPELRSVLEAVAATDPASWQPLRVPATTAPTGSAFRLRHVAAAAAIAGIFFTAGWFFGRKPASEAPRSDGPLGRSSHDRTDDLHSEAAEVFDLMRRAQPVAEAVLYRGSGPAGETRDVTFASGGRRLEEDKRDQATVSVGVVADGMAWTFSPRDKRLQVAESRPSATPDLFDPSGLSRLLESAFVIESVRDETIGGVPCRVIRARPRASGKPIAVAVDAASGIIRRLETSTGAAPAVLDLVGPRALDATAAFNVWDYASKASVVDCDWREVHLSGVPPGVFMQTMVMVIDGSSGKAPSFKQLPPEVQRAVRAAVKELDPAIRRAVEQALDRPASRGEQ